MIIYHLTPAKKETLLWLKNDYEVEIGETILSFSIDKNEQPNLLAKNILAQLNQ